MLKKDEAKKILEELNMPSTQQSDICCYTLLAMGSIAEQSEWGSATNEWIRIHDIMQFIDLSFNVRYAENSRETFRKQAIHHFRNAAIIEDNGKATNSPNYRYRLTDEFLIMIRTYGNYKWSEMLEEFCHKHASLVEMYASKKKMTMMPIKVNEKEIAFTTGKHNRLQKLIIEEFAPRFAPYSECLYVGDTAEKDKHKDLAKLQQLGSQLRSMIKCLMWFFILPIMIGYTLSKRLQALDQWMQNEY